MMQSKKGKNKYLNFKSDTWMIYHVSHLKYTSNIYIYYNLDSKVRTGLDIIPIKVPLSMLSGVYNNL